MFINTTTFCFWKRENKSARKAHVLVVTREAGLGCCGGKASGFKGTEERRSVRHAIARWCVGCAMLEGAPCRTHTAHTHTIKESFLRARGDRKANGFKGTAEYKCMCDRSLVLYV